MLAALSLYPFYFFGLGGLLPNDEQRESLFNRLLAGLLLNYLLCLCFRFELVVWIGAFLCGIGWRRILANGPRSVFIGARHAWLPIGLAALYCLRLMLDPIAGADPLTIWFAQGQQIFLDRGISFDFIGRESLALRHLDYPKLIPALSGQIAWTAGFWNQTIPRLSLALLLGTAILGTARFTERILSYAVLVIALLLFQGEWVWSSYLDGYLALYTGLALVYYGKFRVSGQRTDQTAFLLSLGVLLALKKEGMPIVFCIVAAILMLEGRSVFRQHSPSMRLLAWVLLPWAVWQFRVWQWSLPSDMTSGHPLTTSLNRLGNFDAIAKIAKYLWQNLYLWQVLAFGVAVYTLGSWLRRRARLTRSREATLCLTFAGLYLAIVFGMFLVTPHELEWHLASAAFRLVKPVSIAILVAVYWIIYQEREAS